MPVLYQPTRWSKIHGRIVLWHGCTSDDAADIINNGVDPSKGRPDTDFGRGFYLTTRERQARQWAWKRYYDLPPARQGGGNHPTTLRFAVPRDDLGRLESLHFVLGDFDSEDYWSMVHHCRGSTARKVKHHMHPDPARSGWYDMVSGPVAAFWQQRVAMTDADQVSFHTAASAVLLNGLIRSKRRSDFRMVPV